MTEASSLWSLTTGAFRDAVAAEATPGCGAVSAATAVFGLALVLKGLNVSEARHPEARRGRLIAEAQDLMEALSGLADRDVAVFSAYLKTVKQSGSPGHAAGQQDALGRAKLSLTTVPLAIAQCCLEGLDAAVASWELCAADLRSDVIGGGLLLHSALTAALLAVDADVSALEDAGTRQSATDERAALQEAADQNVQLLTRRHPR